MSGFASCSGGGIRIGCRASCKERAWNARDEAKVVGSVACVGGGGGRTWTYQLCMPLSDPGILGIDVPHAIISGYCLLFWGRRL
ncbi:hypothetical protein BHE74_00044948, partial [Ensete ventricosum]